VLEYVQEAVMQAGKVMDFVMLRAMALAMVLISTVQSLILMMVIVLLMKTVQAHGVVQPLQMSVERVMQIAPMTVYRIVLVHGVAVQ
jgi:hypothetical protein